MIIFDIQWQIWRYRIFLSLSLFCSSFLSLPFSSFLSKRKRNKDLNFFRLPLKLTYYFMDDFIVFRKTKILEKYRYHHFCCCCFFFKEKNVSCCLLLFCESYCFYRFLLCLLKSMLNSIYRVWLTQERTFSNVSK